MIGPIGLLLHMTGAAIVGVIAGGWFTIYMGATGMRDRAKKRGLKNELQLILMPEAEYEQHQADKIRQYNDWTPRCQHHQPFNAACKPCGRA